LGNKYFNDTEPWHTRKTNLKACGNTIHVSLQICASLSVLMDPVLPHAAATLREMLNLHNVRPSVPGASKEGQIGWADAGRPLLDAGSALNEPTILFTKIEDEVITREIERLKSRAGENGAEAVIAAEETAPYVELKPEIVYDDFARIDLRMGTVLVAERIPKSDKLLRLDVDLGFEKRQILAGVAEQMAPEDLVGKRVVVVANLAPRKLRGFESKGMLLMAEDRDGRLSPVVAEGENGAVVR
jgi:methionyl-tRNA synthetase